MLISLVRSGYFYNYIWKLIFFFLVLSVPMAVYSYERDFLGYWIWGEYVQNLVWFAIQIFFPRRIWSRTMATPHAVAAADGRRSVPWHGHQNSQPGSLAFGLGLPPQSPHQEQETKWASASSTCFLCKVPDISSGELVITQASLSLLRFPFDVILNRWTPPPKTAPFKNP